MNKILTDTMAWVIFMEEDHFFPSTVLSLPYESSYQVAVAHSGDEIMSLVRAQTYNGSLGYSLSPKFNAISHNSKLGL